MIIIMLTLSPNKSLFNMVSLYIRMYNVLSVAKINSFDLYQITVCFEVWRLHTV